MIKISHLAIDSTESI